MSDRDELAGIVAGLRRTLARAGSDSELIVRAKRDVATRTTTAEVVERGPTLPTPAEPVTQTVSPLARPSPRAPITSSPAARPDFADTPNESAAVAGDLFGPPKPAFVFERPSAVAVAPPPVELHPAGTEARAELFEASLPILEQVASEACACTKCGLSGTRTRAVPGTGSAQSGIVFVGEAPGAEEDRQGKPFVGRAGELLTKMIQAMEDKRLLAGVPLSRDTVYICNVLKCRPPENRNPLPHEVEACSPYLMRQLEALKPRVICCLGKFAAELLLGVKGTIAGMRGRTYRWRGSKLIVTYHPAACLRNPNLKGPVWEDLQLLAREYLSD
jgi:uracil-DNA glycosylase